MPLYRALSAAPAPPAPKPATPPLPAELTDYILDCLEGHRPALFSCALVCRAWLPRARHHAFRTLHLTPDNVDGFLALLSAPSGTLGRGRTRALHVRQNQTHGRKPLLDKLLASPLIPDALAHVEQLTVLYANWTPRAAEARFGAFARVTVLKLCLPGYPTSACNAKSRQISVRLTSRMPAINGPADIACRAPGPSMHQVHRE